MLKQVKAGDGLTYPKDGDTVIHSLWNTQAQFRLPAESALLGAWESCHAPAELSWDVRRRAHSSEFGPFL